MRRSVAILSILFVAVAAGAGNVYGESAKDRAEALWAARGDLSKAAEALTAYEAMVQQSPKDYDALLRLTRVHYWIGQNLEATDEKSALSHYGKGKEYGKRAAEAAPDQPGGYFFGAACLARENSLKGSFSNLFGIKEVRRQNEKAASIQADYFYRGPDRFFCAYYTKLPGLLGGSVSKAIVHGRKAVEAHPNYIGNRVFLAEAYLKDGKEDLARRELEAAIAVPEAALPDVIPEQRLEKKKAEALLKKIPK